MKQPSRNANNRAETKAKDEKKPKKNGKPAYGTSKLEEDFAREFLDKLGVEYMYQFEAKDIGRFYDFFIKNENLIIEIDGDYWHGNPKKYSDGELKYHQKKAKRVDELKNKWALMHGIPILRIWEDDIRKKPGEVMKILKECVSDAGIRSKMVENRRKKHIHKKIEVIEDEN